jgi:hypothetical protein
MTMTTKKCIDYHGGRCVFRKKEEEFVFHDLHAFNAALLAKQCWRLMDEPNSLCARLLCAKYYPDGNLLNAKLKSGSYFTCQSVIYGIQTFNHGCISR